MEMDFTDIIIKNIIINSENSGTLGRLIMGILVDTPHKIKLLEIKVYQKETFIESLNH